LIITNLLSALKDIVPQFGDVLAIMAGIALSIEEESAGDDTIISGWLRETSGTGAGMRPIPAKYLGTCSPASRPAIDGCHAGWPRSTQRVNDWC
jgi:hypothetical protein